MSVADASTCGSDVKYPSTSLIEIAARRAEMRRDEHRGPIRSAAPERRHALTARGEKAGNDDDVVRGQLRSHADRIHRDRAGVAPGRADAGLVHVDADRAHAERLQRERQQRDRSQFARRPQQIERVGLGRQAEPARFSQQRIRVSLLRGDDRDDAPMARHDQRGQTRRRVAIRVEARQHAAADLQHREVIVERPALSEPVIARVEGPNHAAPHPTLVSARAARACRRRCWQAPRRHRGSSRTSSRP